MSCINEEIITWTLMHEIGGVPPLISFHYMLSEFTAFHKRSNAWWWKGDNKEIKVLTEVRRLS